MKSLYKEVQAGAFIKRPNRFVVVLDLDGQETKCHLPNPGRMWELLYPGVTIYVTPHPKEGAATQHRVIGIERDGVPIMLDTNYSNDVAQYLVDHKLIEGWEEWSVVRREYTVGKSRFDLLIINDKGPKLQEEGYHTGVLFLVQWDRARWFLPDYHTDLAFAQTFQEVADRLDWKAVSLAWDKTFTLPKVIGPCRYPADLLAQEAHDSGVYAMVLQLEKAQDLEIGSKGILHFKEGYYIYVGSAKAHLSKRLERHKRKRKKMHWHLDYLRGSCHVIAALPIRTAVPLECLLAKAVEAVADWSVPGFGCSDCHCQSHLFGMVENPIHSKAFMDVIEDFRMNRLDQLIDE